MTRRIAIGGFLHESHSFAPRPTTYADFVRPAGFPPLTEGDAMLDAVRGRSVPAAGALAVAEAAAAVVVPLAWSFANPAGPVQDEAFERIAALICAALSRALDAEPLDGVYLDLHGAAVAESFPDAEGEILRRVRAIVGDLPLTISLDPHANLTARMVTLADTVVPFRTYPHIDMKDAGAQAMRLLLQRIDRGAPWARAFRQLPFWLPLGSQCTLLQPMSEVMAERAALAERLDVVELAFCFGFPYADFADCGAAIAAMPIRRRRPMRQPTRSLPMRGARGRFRAGPAACVRGGGRGEAVGGARVEAHRDCRYAGQSRWRRPWRHDRHARRTRTTAGEGRGPVPDQRRGERRRMRGRR
jgi:microcystin degradation protein MlrC